MQFSNSYESLIQEMIDWTGRNAKVFEGERITCKFAFSSIKDVATKCIGKKFEFKPLYKKLKSDEIRESDSDHINCKRHV